MIISTNAVAVFVKKTPRMGNGQILEEQEFLVEIPRISP